MYPPVSTEEGYPPHQKGYPPTAPPPSMGIPVGGHSQDHPPATASAFHVQSQTPGPWSTGMCDCCDDVGNCCLTCWCPCVTFGRIAEIVDRGSTSCGASGALYALIQCITGCGWLYSCIYRSKMRRQYSLPASPCHDCLVHLCCEPCALCQEYRELKNRGFDMVLGVLRQDCNHVLSPSQHRRILPTGQKEVPTGAAAVRGHPRARRPPVILGVSCGVRGARAMVHWPLRLLRRREQLSFFVLRHLSVVGM